MGILLTEKRKQQKRNGVYFDAYKQCWGNHLPTNEERKYIKEKGGAWRLSITVLLFSLSVSRMRTEIATVSFFPGDINKKHLE